MWNRITKDKVLKVVSSIIFIIIWYGILFAIGRFLGALLLTILWFSQKKYEKYRILLKNKTILWYNLFSETKGGIVMANKTVTRSDVKNGDLNGAIRRWKQQNARNNLASEVNKRKFHIKNGVKRKMAEKEGIKKARKRNKRDRDY